MLKEPRGFIKPIQWVSTSSYLHVEIFHFENKCNYCMCGLTKFLSDELILGCDFYNMKIQTCMETPCIVGNT